MNGIETLRALVRWADGLDENTFVPPNGPPATAEQIVALFADCQNEGVDNPAHLEGRRFEFWLRARGPHNGGHLPPLEASEQMRLLGAYMECPTCHAAAGESCECTEGGDHVRS